ncbi:MAG: uL15m family ribosomal protein [Halobacteriales archaeon]
MTDKKKRQRGRRTHGGGSQKNRRGAGHRGGRGDAGRSKHEQHLHEPLGKHGFTRPEAVQEEILEVSVRKLDEDAAVYAAGGLAEEVDGGYAIDAREVVDDGFDADAVKVLGDGQVRNELTVTADAFTGGAVAKIEGAGGEAVLSERGEERAEEGESEDSSGDDNDQ